MMEELEYYSSSQVARELDVDLTLLKKLSSIIEKTVMNPKYFYRDNRNRRLYTVENMNEIEEILTLKQNKKLSYTAAVYQKFSKSSKMLNSSTIKKEELSDILTKITKQETLIQEQSTKIDMLTTTIEKLLNLENQNYEVLLALTEKVEKNQPSRRRSTTQTNTTNRNSSTNKEASTPQTMIEREKNQTMMNLTIQSPAGSKSGTTMIKKAEFLDLRKKLKYLPFKWSESRDNLNLSKKDYHHYSEYIDNSKAFLDEMMNPRKIGSYYFVKREQKEKLSSYGNFYDTLDMAVMPTKKNK